MRTELNDRTVSTVQIDGLYEVAVKFTDEWHIVGEYDLETAIIKHKKLENLAKSNIFFILKNSIIF